jgi:mRNA interferase MazF
MTKPGRGEIWEINFDPSEGAEIKKKRPAVVISSDSIGRLPLKIVVPVTEWKPRYDEFPWHIKIESNAGNGLSKPSVADTFQVKSISEKRFIKKIGSLTKDQLDEIAAAIAVCIDFELNI